MKSARLLSVLLALVGPGPLTGLVAEEQRSQAPGADATNKLDLNGASEAALAAVPEIGPNAARAIIAARPFKNLDDLDRVKGIPAETLEQIRAKVRVSAAIGAGGLGEPTRQKKRLGEPASAAAPGNPRAVDINTAPREKLAAIPVIGADLADQIVAARPFKSLDELNRLEGLSAERLEQVRAVLTIQPAPRRTTAP